MRVFRELLWKNVLDAFWPLAVSALALFGLGWLSVYQTLRVERRIRDAVARGDFQQLLRFGRGFGGMTLDYSSASIEMNGWNLPFVLLPVIVWAIGRGSMAVAGELERGTMDLIMSRPVRRSTFLLAHVAAAVVGLLVLSGCLLGGHFAGVQYNKIQAPPSFEQVCRPAINLSCLGFVIFAATLLVSSGDRTRWRATLAGSCFALISYSTIIVVNQPGMEDYKYLEHYSIFKAYNPVEVATRGTTFIPNVETLVAIGSGLLVISLVNFARRDLPAGS